MEAIGNTWAVATVAASRAGRVVVSNAAKTAHIVQQRTRLKDRVHAVLQRNLVPRCPAEDLFGHRGRAWLAEQPLAEDESGRRGDVVAAVGLSRRGVSVDRP